MQPDIISWQTPICPRTPNKWNHHHIWTQTMEKLRWSGLEGRVTQILYPWGILAGLERGCNRLGNSGTLRWQLLGEKPEAMLWNSLWRKNKQCMFWFALPSTCCGLGSASPCRGCPLLLLLENAVGIDRWTLGSGVPTSVPSPAQLELSITCVNAAPIK